MKKTRSRSRSRARFLFVPLVALVGVVLVGLLRPASAVSGAEETRRTRPGIESGEARATASVRRGSLQRYRYRSRTAVRSEISGTMSSLATQVEGRLEMRHYGAGGEALIGMRFASLKIDTVGSGGASAGATLAGREFFVRRDRDGRTQSLHFPKGMRTEERNLLRGLLSPLEVVLPDPPRERWESMGTDSAGRFIAEYRILSQSGRRTELLRKRRYLEPHLPGNRGAVSLKNPFRMKTSGETRIALDSLDLERLEGEEGIEIGGEGEMLAVRISSNSSVEIRRIDAIEKDAGVLALTEEARALASSVLPSGLVPEAIERRNRSGTTSVGSVLAQLREALERDRWLDLSPAVFLSLLDLLEASASAREEVLALLRRGELPEKILGLLADALAQTSEGAGAVVGLATDERLPEATRRIAVEALAHARDLTEELIHCLGGLAAAHPDGRLGAAAIASLGMAAVSSASRDRKDGAARALLPLLGGSEERDLKLLSALGNVGSAESLREIVRLSGSESVRIRSQAALALRNIEGAVEGLARFGKDADPAVREYAVLALRMRKERGAAAALERIAREDGQETVRMEALRYFLDRRDPEARAIIRRAAAEDPSAAVRKFLADRLNK